ncbi:VanZ family protein [Nocardioides sp. R-C-SC26]|uniref:VanZ family protein n=1 Tax=Nocardioides sp. R-C-SC26 TaxID=2870414 RepID=UPI001E636EA5|nr:VanZ family protein [Nocardioides sp. R-C-SC26]
MFPVGGVEVMLLGVVLAAMAAVPLAWALRRRLGWVAAVGAAGLLWSLVVIALVTLIPFDGPPGWVSEEYRLDHCSWDLGGPAPDGFWIFSGTQRLLNTLIFMPSGALLVLALARWPRWLALALPLGWVTLAGYAVGIEYTQLVLARLDRACDITDMVDNATGAALGIGIGLLLAVALRPWRGGVWRPSRRGSRDVLT